MSRATMIADAAASTADIHSSRVVAAAMAPKASSAIPPPGRLNALLSNNEPAPSLAASCVWVHGSLSSRGRTRIGSAPSIIICMATLPGVSVLLPSMRHLRITWRRAPLRQLACIDLPRAGWR